MTPTGTMSRAAVAPSGSSPDDPIGGGDTPATGFDGSSGSTEAVSDASPSGYGRDLWRSPRWVASMAVTCVAVLTAATVVVLYCVGPLVHDRDQRSLMATERTAIADAAHDDEGLYRPKLPTQPPDPGSVVGILAVPVLGLQQAVVEGAGPAQTASGPGHVPGTAGLGQPGNSAVVGRRSGYGGPFGNLGQLRPGDHIVTATTQGQALYIVRTIRTVTVTNPKTPAAAASAPSVTTTTYAHAARKATTTHPKVVGEPKVSTEQIYGPSTHNQLTLVTSASVAPWNTDQATVVVARLRGLPYTPTPQESRSPSQYGTSGDPTVLAWLILALLALVGTLYAAVALYRRTTVRSAYLLTTAPLLTFTVLAAEAAIRLLPAWL